MPNTPRTLAELDALYSDNNAGAISAQDLRDGFESVANPVPGGGLEPWRVDYPDCDAVLTRYSGSGIQTVNSGYGASQPLILDAAPDSLWDPSGLFQTDAYDSDYWGFEFPAYGWAQLPQGVWQLSTVTTWEHNTGYRVAGMEIIETYAGDGFIAAGGSGYTGSNFGIDGNNTMLESVIVSVPPAETPPVSGLGAPYEVGYVFTQVSGAPKKVFYAQMNIKRLAF